MNIPPPPPGFVMQGGDVPPPPPGFVLQGSEPPPAIPERKPEPPAEPGLMQRARELLSGVNYEGIAGAAGMLPSAVGSALGYVAEKAGAPETAAALRDPVGGVDWWRRRLGDVGIQDVAPTDATGRLLRNVGGQVGGAATMAPLSAMASGGKALLQSPDMLRRFAATEAGGAIGAGIGQTAGQAITSSPDTPAPVKMLGEMLAAMAGGAAGAGAAGRLTRPPPQADPLAAMRQAKARELGVDLTAGQATANPQAQLLEQEALRGRSGSRAQGVIQDAVERQQGALTSAFDDVAQRVTGGRQVERGEGAQRVQQALLDKADEMGRATDAAYDVARQAKGGVKNEALRGGDLRMAVADYSLDSAPKARSLLDEFDKMASGGEATVPFSELESYRRKLVNAKAGADATDRGALGKMQGALDDLLGRKISKAMIEGDMAGIDAYAKARGLRASFGRVFEQGDIVERLVERQGTGKVLAVSPDMAANVILGADRLGLAADKNLAALKKALPAEQWQSLRGEAWTRLFGDAVRTDATTGAKTFDGAAFSRALDAAASKNGNAYRMLFDAEERRALAQLRDVADLVKVRPGGVNASNSGAAVALFQRSGAVLRNIPGIGPMIDAALAGMSDARAAGRMRDAVAGKVPMRRPEALGAARMPGTRGAAQVGAQYQGEE